MNKLGRRQIWILSIGLFVLGLGLSGQKAWANQSDMVSFAGIKRIVVFEKWSPWPQDPKDMKEEISMLNSIQHKIKIQDAAADYVSKNLDQKLKKCIDVVVPKDPGEYYQDPANRLLIISWDVNQWTLEGKPQTLVSFSLSEAHPDPHSGDHLIRTMYFMPTQAMFFHDETQIDSGIQVVAARLMTKIVHDINIDNSCGG